MAKKIGILGSGNVGLALANGLKGEGYEVEISNRTAHKVDGWEGPVSMYAEVAENADLVILAVKGSAAEGLVEEISDSLVDKTVIDTTNPISDAPPTDGVVSFFTSLDNSLMERLQRLSPDIHFVKAFNSVGSGNMVKPTYKEGKPTMFICGNDQAAKKETAEVLDKLGWGVEDMGSVTASRAIEPLCMLWCIRGYQHNLWDHAFKLLKP